MVRGEKNIPGGKPSSEVKGGQVGDGAEAGWSEM